MTSKIARTAAVVCLTLGAGACSLEPADNKTHPDFASSTQAVAPPGSDASPVSTTLPMTMAPGERIRVNTVMRNDGINLDGTNDWDSSYVLYRTNGLWSWVFTRVTGVVTPGNNATFSYVITAPTAPGTYSYGGEMRPLGDAPFGTGITVNNISVSAANTPQWSCTWDQANSTVPASLAPGEQTTAVFRVQNTGTQTWQPTAPGTCLRSRDNPTYFWGTPSNCVYLTAPVAPGGFVDISVPLTAPSTPGTYNLRRQMYDFRPEGVGFFSLTSDCINTNINVSSTAMVLDSSLQSEDFPVLLAPGERREVTVVMRNTGTETWLNDNNYFLASNSSPTSLFGVTVLRVTSPTPQNSDATFTFVITAPSTEGNYNYRFRMRKISGADAGFFGQQIDIPMTVSAGSTPQYGATVVSQVIPTLITVGMPYTFSITMQNSGSTNWVGPDVLLYTANSPASLWGYTVSSLGSGETIIPGQNRTFNLPITAPATPGFYNSVWQMRELSTVGLFGEQAITLNIEATLCGNSSIDAGEECDDGNLNDADGCSSACLDESFEVDLVNPVGKTFYGSNDLKLMSAVQIGDVTNDGTPEIILGEISNVIPPVGAFRNQAGQVVGYSSTPGFLDGATVTLPNGGPAFQILGRDANDRLGLVTSQIRTGDVTGDGIADLVIAAPESSGIDNTEALAGEVYVLAGGAGLTGVIDLRSPPAGVVVSRIYGRNAGDQLRVLDVGDLTGDGVADIVLGAPGDDTGGPDAGAIFVLGGGATLVATSTVDLGAPAPALTLVSIVGDGNGGSLGGTASIGDFGGSTDADLVVGNAGYDVPSNNIGAAWGFFGPLTTPTLATADVRWQGQSANAKLGGRVRVAQVSGDGTGDVVIGSVQHRKGDGLQYGAVDVWQGPLLAGTIDVSSAAPTARVLGADQFDNLGQALALGDWNNDGFADLVISASTADGDANARDRAGEVYVVFGGPLLAASLDLAVGTPLVRIVGARVRDLLGHQPASIAVGDLDGDGFADTCVGAQLGGPPGSNPGSVHCVNNPF